MTKRFSVLLGLVLLVSCVATAADSGTLPPAPSPRGMVLIPAGSFLMGDSFGEGASCELLVQTVSVSAFWMDTYEVTKGLWDEVASRGSSHGYDIGPGGVSDTEPAHPVYWLSWYEAVKWANLRSEEEGLTPCYYTDSSQRAVYRTGNLDLPTDSVKWTANGYRLADRGGVGEGGARRGCGAAVPVGRQRRDRREPRELLRKQWRDNAGGEFCPEQVRPL